MKNSQRKNSMNRRTFIKMSSGAVVAVSANWFLPKITLGAEPPIKLGAICATSGAVSTMGVEQLQAINLNLLDGVFKSLNTAFPP